MSSSTKTSPGGYLWCLLAILSVLISACGIPDGDGPIESETPTEIVFGDFDGERAIKDVAAQLEFGPRYPGSEGHALVQQWIQSSLQAAGWQIELMEFEYQRISVTNIIATLDQGDPVLPWVVIGAHYDTRKFADRDPDPALRSEPVPGANDGASGVAVLLELGRTMPRDLRVNVSLVFFDAEDNGGIDGWDWIIGSQAYAAGLSVVPSKVIVVDMIGDADQNIYMEESSDVFLNAEIWDAAAGLGVESFIPERKYSIIDDHTPFLEVGISAIDLIDFDYSYWHTTHDTLDKVSAESLQNVGDVIIEWLNRTYGT